MLFGSVVNIYALYAKSKIFYTTTHLLTNFVNYVLMWIFSMDFFNNFLAESGIPCQTPTFNIQIGLVMYASYAILFANFLNKTYSEKGKHEKRE